MLNIQRQMDLQQKIEKQKEELENKKKELEKYRKLQAEKIVQNN